MGVSEQQNIETGERFPPCRWKHITSHIFWPRSFIVLILDLFYYMNIQDCQKELFLVLKVYHLPISYSFSELVGLLGLLTGAWEGFLTAMCAILRQLHLWDVPTHHRSQPDRLCHRGLTPVNFAPPIYSSTCLHQPPRVWKAAGCGWWNPRWVHVTIPPLHQRKRKQSY